jgi:polar amino acid transport system substrate-binding protein
MAIVYGIVKQHNGQINVYSEPGKGTTFRVYLPLVTDEAAPEPLPASAAPPRRGSETILLAEDDAAVRDLEERILTGFGHKVIVATDGEEAVELFRRHAEEIALIVMDLIMPGKSGAEAYEEIRKIKEGVKVLYTSGYPRDFIEGREEIARKIELLMKPVQPMALLKKVREMLDTPAG